MILFLSQNKNKDLETFVTNFSEKTQIKTAFYTVSDLYKNCNFSVSCKNNQFTSKLNNINFNDIKLCYINSSVLFYNEIFEFKKKLDKEYALQEWNASFLCLLKSAINTKFINPILKKYDCYTDFEHILLFKKFDLDTVELFLTNNSENFLTLYNIYDGNIIIKNLLTSMNKMKMFTKSDLNNLDKLYLSPYLFQRYQTGYNILILMIGDKLIAYNETKNEKIQIPIGIKEKLIDLKNELNVSIVLYSLIYDNGNYYFYLINQMPDFSLLVSLFKKDFILQLEDYLIKEYNN